MEGVVGGQGPLDSGTTTPIAMHVDHDLADLAGTFSRGDLDAESFLGALGRGDE
jgi:hypothetical protein